MTPQEEAAIEDFISELQQIVETGTNNILIFSDRTERLANSILQLRERVLRAETERDRWIDRSILLERRLEAIRNALDPNHDEERRAKWKERS